MTFATLEIDAQIMRESNSDYFTVIESDNELQELFKNPAKNQLKIDVSNVLNFRTENTSDMSLLDNLVNDYITDFKQLLMYLQCFYYYQSIDGGQGTKTNSRMVYYSKMYSEKLRSVQNMKVGNFSKVMMKKLKRG